MGQTVMRAAHARMPGAWLLVVARLVFSESVLTTVIHQTIADMRAEWLAAGTNLFGRFSARWRGCFAFWRIAAISPFAFRNWRDLRETARVPLEFQRRLDMKFVKQFRLVAVLLAAGLICGYVVARMQPVMYRSSAIIERVPPHIASGTVGEALIESLGGVSTRFNVVVSRTALERMIHEFNLYQRERESMTMEDVVALMFNRLSFNAVGEETFRLAYTGSDPETVKKVTEHVASLFVDDSVKRRTSRIDGTLAFLQRRIDETGQRLEALGTNQPTQLLLDALKGTLSRPKLLELEVLQTTYKNLLTQREEALATRDLERQQIGEQFVVLDAARLPERPIGPSRLRFTLIGGAIGIGVAALISLGLFVGRIVRGRRGRLTAETA
jgi:hypothetical protein